MDFQNFGLDTSRCVLFMYRTLRRVLFRKLNLALERFSLGKVPLDIVTWKSTLGDCHLGKYLKKLSLGKLPLEFITWESTFGNYHLGKYLWKLLIGKVSLEFVTWESIFRNCHLGKYL